LWRQVVADASALESDATREQLPDVNGDFRGSFSGYERDHLYYNPDGRGRFFDAGYVFGLDFVDDGRAAVPVDVDGDGDLDLVMQSLQGLRVAWNDLPPRSWTRIGLRATQTDAQAFGAIVEVHANDVVQRHILSLTDGFQSQVPRDLHFGLADADTIERVRVHWPSGTVEDWTDLPVRKRLALVEGQRAATATELAQWPQASRPQPIATARPDLVAPTLDGEPLPLTVQAAGEARPVLVNFWAPWCAPCRTELPELRALAQQFAGKVDFVGVSVEREDLAAVRGALAEFEPGYAQRIANDALLEAFFPDDEQAVLPSTFVFDDQGRLRRIFRRPVQRADVSSLLASFESEGTFARDALARGLAQLEQGDLRAAVDSFRRALEADPDLAVAHFEVGKVWTRVGNHDKAEEYFQNAVRADADHAAAQFNLGVARLQLGKASEAIAPLQASLRLRGDDAQTLLTLAVAARDAGDFELALTTCDRAAALDEASPVPYVVKAETYVAADALDAARASYREALQRAPSAVEIQAALDALR